MGCCVGATEKEKDPEYKGEKLERNDNFEGPVKDRGCTDVLWCLLLIFAVGLYFLLAISALTDGDPTRMIKGQDFQGKVCGSTDVTDMGEPLKDYGYVYYGLNMTKAAEKLTGSAGFGGGSMDLSSALSSGGGVMGMLTGSGVGPSAMVAEISTYLTPVCVKSCDIPATTRSAPAWPAVDSITQRPNGGPKDKENPERNDAYYGEAFGSIWSDSAISAWGKINGGNPMEFDALPSDFCPYAPQYCVPVDGIEVTGLADAYCVPTVGAALDAAAAADVDVEGMIPESWSKASSSTFDDMMADINTAAMSFAIVAVIALVTGIAYLIFMRFFIGVLVWTSLILIFLLLISGGGMLYVKSTQCLGVSLQDSASSTAAAGLEAGKAATGIWNTTEEEVDVEAIQGGCELDDGTFTTYEIADETQRDALQYCSFFVFGLAAVYLICMLCNCGRIKLAIAINKVAAMFVANTPTSILVPPIQIAFCFVWWLIWGYIIVFIIAYIPPCTQADSQSASCGFASVPTHGLTYHQAAGIEATSANGNVGEAGTCSCWSCSSSNNGMYRSEFKWGAEDAEPNVLKLPAKWADWAGTVSAGDDEGTPTDYLGSPVYKCAGIAYAAGGNPFFWYAFFVLLWVNAFVIAVGQMTIAFGVSSWYFAKEKKMPGIMLVSFKNTMYYHAGTCALGSFILAVIQLIKYFLYYLSEQAKKQNNKVMEYILKALAYLVWCFEQCVKFLNKNAYIQCALNGTKFCTSAKNAFWLLLRNAGRVAAVGFIAPFIHFFGIGFLTVASGWIGYQLLPALYDEGKLNSVVGPVILYVIIGYVIGKLIMNVFGLAVDTTLQCFVADEEMSGGAKHTPGPLKEFLDSDDFKAQNEKDQPTPVKPKAQQ